MPKKTFRVSVVIPEQTHTVDVEAECEHDAEVFAEELILGVDPGASLVDFEHGDCEIECLDDDDPYEPYEEERDPYAWERTYFGPKRELTNAEREALIDAGYQLAGDRAADGEDIDEILGCAYDLAEGVMLSEGLENGRGFERSSLMLDIAADYVAEGMHKFMDERLSEAE